MKIILPLFFSLTWLLFLTWCSGAKDVIINDTGTQEQPTESQKDNQSFSQQFKKEWLSTNTDKTSIDLELVLDGWPGKDGIPSIDEPTFVDIEDASNEYLSPESEWIFVKIWDEKRRYSYNILNRHEIVNDTFGEWEAAIDVAVTFCPLCWSALVFERLVDGKTVEFGVSWKLYNSNLLMFDRETESLRSQSLAEAVVGEHLWKMLTFVDSDILTRDELKEFHPTSQVLSTDTWTRRDYERIPYGSYDTNDELIFPIANMEEEARFQIKTRFFISNIDEETSIAFHMDDLRDAWAAELDVAWELYTASFATWDRKMEDPDGNELPWYFEMRFSRANKNPRAKWVWSE